MQKLILDDYRYIRNDITDLTGGLPLYHTILSAIALGDGKLHSVYKRSSVSDQVGDNAVEDLVEKGIIKVTKVKNSDDRLYFTTPFLRFWFAFVSPLFKGIRDGDYKEVQERWENKKNEFFQEAFVRLSHELLRKTLKEKQIMKISQYYDEQNSFEIYADTKEKEIILGSVKYTNNKIKKSALTKLQSQAKEAGLKVDTYVIISKKGFSSELKSHKGEMLKLLTLKNFKALVD